MCGVDSVAPQTPLLLPSCGTGADAGPPARGCRTRERQEGRRSGVAQCFSALGHISVTWGAGTKHRCLSSAQAWLGSPGAAEVESTGLRV